MQQNKGIGKIITIFIFLMAFIVVTIFSVVAYVKEPTAKEIEEYIKEEQKKGGKEKPDGTKPDGSEILGGTDMQETTTTSYEEPVVVNPLIPAGATVVASATVNDIHGHFEGEVNYTQMDGYDKIEGAPDNINDMVNDEISSPKPLVFDISNNGEWEFSIDSQLGMSLSSDDLKDPSDAENGLSGIELINSIDNGHFQIDRSLKEGSDDAHFLLDGYLCEDASGRFVVGNYEVSVYDGDNIIIIKASYTARYTGPAAE